MLIVGAGGLAAQMFQEIEIAKIQDVVFWSETPTKFKFIEDKYPILKTDEEVSDFFARVSNAFVLGVGDTAVRKKMVDKFTALGGRLTTYISPDTELSPFIGSIGEGSMLLKDVAMEPGVTVGRFCLLNRKSNYGHGCTIADNCEIGPFAVVSADVEIGENTLIGIGSIILPKVKIGRNVIVSAGSVVTKNLPDNAVVSGSPAIVRFFKKVKPETA
jgi:sugar O-acyltransferase (sialic acid O-acetyltransferase NeuD family)